MSAPGVCTYYSTVLTNVKRTFERKVACQTHFMLLNYVLKMESDLAFSTKHFSTEMLHIHNPPSFNCTFTIRLPSTVILVPVGSSSCSMLRFCTSLSILTNSVCSFTISCLTLLLLFTLDLHCHCYCIDSVFQLSLSLSFSFHDFFKLLILFKNFLLVKRPLYCSLSIFQIL
jgi:hypothetical protein